MSNSVKTSNKRRKSASSDGGIRKRGRPSGKNRVPLTLEERRARNAQYERERRNEYADAMIELAEAMGAETSIPNADLLATVLSYFQKATGNNKNPTVEDLKRQNELISIQIAMLDKQLNRHQAI